MRAEPSARAFPDDIRTEAQALADEALASHLQLRLMGGLAIWLRSPSVRRPPFARDYDDMDFAASSSERRETGAFFERRGYVPERLFNAIHGARRLNYSAPDQRWTIDVIFDELQMSHRIDLRGRLSGPEPTLQLADLLLTKLQIWEITRKDLGDIACLLADHALDSDGSDSIDLRRILALAGSDWGLCHTIERNLGKVRELWQTEPSPGTPLDAGRQALALVQAIQAAPKSLGWKARDRIGERVRWYETPEEVRHVARPPG